jgi:hypothetical protein
MKTQYCGARVSLLSLTTSDINGAAAWLHQLPAINRS